jgi:hypothetical protein
LKKLGVLVCIAILAGLGATTTSGATSTAVTKKCHPSYKGACLKIGVGDYDCGGGSGNGPNYVWKRVRVVGPDVFRLDADHDGWGCE